MNALPVIILLGPTAVGKTGASLLLAQALGTEIISADSMQVYRHMDIGTAKPSAGERARVRHHMIDLVEPSETFSAGRYRDMAEPIIENILGQGKVPIVVGGTGLYIRTLTRGIFAGPSADWGLRKELLAQEEETQGYLYRRLTAVDPDAASRIMPADTRRLLRALEVSLTTKTGISELRKKHTMPLPYRFIKLGLSRDRQELYRLIEQRIDGMIAQGLVDEVRSVLAMDPGRTALQAIGYKEIAAHLGGEYPLEDAIRLIKKRTRNYAKRQYTWFRSEPAIRWADVTGLFAPEAVHASLAILLNNTVT